MASFKLISFFSLLFLSLSSLVDASRDLQLTRRAYSHHSSHSLAKRVNSGNVSFTENSGVCETTPDVYQAAGYVNTTTNNHMWFWFFESRHDPDNAPFVLWLNGGPGCSSMIGLFSEVGPCTVDHGSSSEESTLNPYSWNNFTNILFLDQPIGTGYSTGARQASTLEEAAEDVWTFFQLLFAEDPFKKYNDGRPFIIATESFGVRFAPVFADYFERQNAKIDAGTLLSPNIKITVTSMALSNGKHDSYTQMKSYIPFVEGSYDDVGNYGSLVNNTVLKDIKKSWEDKCAPALEKCNGHEGTGKKAAEECNAALQLCTKLVAAPAWSDRDPADLSRSSSDPSYPDSEYRKYIRNDKIAELTGATTKYDQCDASVHFRFARSGETGRSGLPDLAPFADSKMPILVWAGDLDMKSNWIGVHDSMVAMSWYGSETLNSTEFQTLEMGGEGVATYKTVDQFQFARVFGAGHAMPAYKPKVAYEIFKQFVQGETLHSVSESADPADTKDDNATDDSASGGDDASSGDAPGSNAAANRFRQPGTQRDMMTACLFIFFLFW